MLSSETLAIVYKKDVDIYEISFFGYLYKTCSILSLNSRQPFEILLHFSAFFKNTFFQGRFFTTYILSTISFVNGFSSAIIEVQKLAAKTNVKYT